MTQKHRHVFEKIKKNMRDFSDLAGIDVADELGNALRRVRPLLQQDHRCGLQDEQKIQSSSLKPRFIIKVQTTSHLQCYTQYV